LRNVKDTNKQQLEELKHRKRPRGRRKRRRKKGGSENELKQKK
jgi:hypothetical protein